MRYYPSRREKEEEKSCWWKTSNEDHPTKLISKILIGTSIASVIFGACLIDSYYTVKFFKQQNETNMKYIQYQIANTDSRIEELNSKITKLNQEIVTLKKKKPTVIKQTITIKEQLPKVGKKNIKSSKPIPSVATLSKKQETICKYIMKHNSQVSYKDANYMAYCMVEAGDKFKLDPYLIAGLAKKESNFNRTSVSGAGAVGLMQVHWPSHAKSLPKTFKSITCREDLFNIKNAIYAGTWLYKCAYSTYGSHIKALNCYLGGSSSSYRNGVLGVQKVLYSMQ